MRNVGTHAAGVVIADRPLADMVPLQKLPNKDKDKEVVSTQWEMGDVEKAGPAEDGLPRPPQPHQPRRRGQAHREAAPASRSTCSRLPLDDETTYKLLQRGEAKGVFQLDGAGIRDLLVKMKPDRFADLIAILALYRPGPLNGGMVDEYVDVKHGREAGRLPAPGDEGGPGRDLRRDGLPGTGDADPEPPRRDRAVAGVCVHQGDLEEEDRGDRPGRKQFIEGAVERGLEKDAGREDLRPDRVLRRLRLQQVAHHRLRPRRLPDGLPEGALPDRVHGRPALLGDGRRRAREVLRRAHRRLPADGDRGPAAEHQRGASRRSGSPSEGKIHFGLAAIKGVGFKAVEAIVEARDEGGPFTRPRRPLRARPAGDRRPGVRRGADQGRRVRLPRAAGGASGSPSSPAPRRPARPRRKTASAASAASSTSSTRPRPRNGNGNGERQRQGRGTRSSLPDVPELPDVERLAEEKKVLGFYMSSHPLTRHAARAPGAGDPPGRRPRRRSAEKTEVVLGGMITGVQVKNVQKSRSGLTRMAKLTFEDLTGIVPAMLWPEEFAKFEAAGQERPDRLRPGDARPPPRPGRADRHQDHPARPRPRRAVARVVVTLRKGVDRRTTQLERLLRGRSGIRPGQPRRLPRDPRPGRRPPRDLQGGPVVARSATTTGSSPTSKRPSAPATSACSASAARPPASRPRPRPAADNGLDDHAAEDPDDML